MRADPPAIVRRGWAKEEEEEKQAVKSGPNATPVMMTTDVSITTTTATISTTNSIATITGCYAHSCDRRCSC